MKTADVTFCYFQQEPVPYSTTDDSNSAEFDRTNSISTSFEADIACRKNRPGERSGTTSCFTTRIVRKDMVSVVKRTVESCRIRQFKAALMN